MIRGKRVRRIPALVRDEILLLHDALQRWFQKCGKPLQHHFRPQLEKLEIRIVPATSPKPYADAAIVQIIDPSQQPPIIHAAAAANSLVYLSQLKAQQETAAEQAFAQAVERNIAALGSAVEQKAELFRAVARYGHFLQFTGNPETAYLLATEEIRPPVSSPQDVAPVPDAPAPTAGYGSAHGGSQATTMGRGVGSPALEPDAMTTTANTLAHAQTLQAQDVPVGLVPFSIFNTGVDDSGAPLTDGTVDPHYQIIAAPSPYTAGNAYTVDQTSFPFHGYSPWIHDGDGLSKWIAPVANETNDPSGNYIYQTTFNLKGFDSSTASITGQYLTDDWLDEIDLNGKPVYTFTHTPSDRGQYKGWQTLPQIASNFVPGVNTLDFVVENRVQSNNNPSGFRVELNGTADQFQWQGPSYTWTQNPVANPTVTAPAAQTNTEGDNVSLQVNASDPNGRPLSYDAVDLPPGVSINSTTGLLSGTVEYGAAEDFDGSYNPTIIVSNDQGGSTQTTFAWTIAQAQVAPVLTNPGDQSNAQGDSVSLQLDASQVDNDALTYDATGLPPGLDIDGEAGLISGTIEPNAGTTPYAVTVSATDPLTNLTTSQTFNWTLTAVDTTPVLDSPGDQANAVGDAVALSVGADDFSGNNLTYTASGLPPGLSIDPATGLISGTLPASAASTTPYSVTVSASDGVNNNSQTFNWIVTPIAVSVPDDQSNLEGDNVSLQINASDANQGTLSYSTDGLPPGLAINNTTGLISGTIAAGASANGPYEVTVTVSDGTYDSGQTFTWNVTHTDTTALTMTNPGDQTNVAGDSVNLQIQASDPDGIDTLTYSATGLPTGVDIDPASGLISGTVDEDAVSTDPYAVTVTADDGNGQTVSQTFNWTVNDPVLNVQGAAVNAIKGSNSGSLTLATFTTPDLSTLAEDFTASVDWGDGNSDPVSVTGSNGSFSVIGDHTYIAAGSYPVQVTVVDLAGNSNMASSTATVTDAALTLTGGLQAGAVQQQATNLTVATFTDGDPAAQAGDFTATVDWGDGSGFVSATVHDDGNGQFSVQGSHAYAQNGSYTVTVQVTDAGGAAASATSTVVVGDVYAGIASNLTVASFTDSDPTAQASDFTATIDWGDGNQSSGTVAGSNGTFTVQGTHNYAADSVDQPDGVYAVAVTVTSKGGGTLTHSGGVAVVRPPLTLVGDAEEATAGVALDNAELANFTEPDASDGVDEFSALIDWGDGSPQEAGTIVELAAGQFTVRGSHTYASTGDYTARVSLSQNWKYGYYAVVCPAPIWVAPDPAKPNKVKPVAHDDYVAVQDGTAKGDVLANDWNTSTDQSHTGMKFVVTSSPLYGKLIWEQKADILGFRRNGHFTYQPDNKDTFQSASFTYEIKTANGVSTAKVTIGRNAGYLDYTVAANSEGQQYQKQGGYLLQGGGTKVKSALDWMIRNAGGGNIVILAASNAPNITEDVGAVKSFEEVADDDNLKMGPVELIDFYGTDEVAQTAAHLQEIGNKLRNASAIFIEGGDQGRYIRAWYDEVDPSQVQLALQSAINNHIMFGGTSAGLAVLGQVVQYPLPYPKDDGITSPEAMADPFDPKMNFAEGFLNIPFLQDAIADTHFGLPKYGFPGIPSLNNYDRLGRMMAFLARMTQPGNRPEYLGGAGALGLGVDANTALELDINGNGKLVGDGFAYFFLANNKPKPPLKAGVPLTYATIREANDVTQYSNSVRLYRIWGGSNNSVDLKADDWTLFGGHRLYVWVDDGKLYVGGSPE